MTPAGDRETERKVLLQAGRLNLAQCLLKLGKWIEARNVCDKAIDENEAVAKAWFRRGEAQLALNDCESARADFDKCLVLEPDNKVSASICYLVFIFHVRQYVSVHIQGKLNTEMSNFFSQHIFQNQKHFC